MDVEPMRPAAAPLALGLLLGAVALSGAGAAMAQLSPQSNGPVDISADQLDVQNQKCMAIYTGDAEALQDTSRLRANTINIYYKPLPSHAAAEGGKDSAGGPGSQSCGGLDRMEADGQVYYVTPNQIVKGDHGVYTKDDKTIIVTGDVVIAQGKNVTAGTRLVINTDTGIATMVSDVKGRGKAGRVRTVVYPNQSQTGAAAKSGDKSGGLKAPVAPPPRSQTN
jgi:lipopolysaccharide export system protein LptA